MIGKWVIETGFIVSLTTFWIGYFISGPLKIFTPYKINGLSDPSSFGILVAASVSIAAATIQALRSRKDSSLEVLGTSACLLLGGALTAVCYTTPFVFWASKARGGMTLAVLNAGANSPFFLSVFVAILFSLGSMGCYLSLRGILSIRR